MKKSFLFSLCFGLLLALPSYAAGDDATVLYNQGIDLYEQNKVDQSISAFKKAISIKPDFYEAYYNLARVQEAAGRTQEAMNSYEKLLQLSPNDYESTYQFGEFLYKRGYLSRSLSYLSKIPANSEYKTKADTLSAKIKKRQIELAEESKIKAEQNLKSTTIGNIPAPSGLVIDSNENMFVASFTESKIIKIVKNAQTKVVFADKTKELDGPIGMAIDSYDNIYVANYNKGSVVVFDTKGTPRVLMYVKKPYCISINEEKGKIYITEQQNNSVVSYDISDVLKASAALKKPAARQITAQSAIQPTSQKAETEIKQPVKDEKELEEIKIEKKPEKKVISLPEKDKNPLGVPSIQEATFTRGDPTTSITAPIMIPSEGMFD